MTHARVFPVRPLYWADCFPTVVNVKGAWYDQIPSRRHENQPGESVHPISSPARSCRELALLQLDWNDFVGKGILLRLL